MGNDGLNASKTYHLNIKKLPFERIKRKLYANRCYYYLVYLNVFPGK